MCLIVWSNTTGLDAIVKVFYGCNYYNQLTFYWTTLIKWVSLIQIVEVLKSKNRFLREEEILP